MSYYLFLEYKDAQTFSVKARKLSEELKSFVFFPSFLVQKDRMFFGSSGGFNDMTESFSVIDMAAAWPNG